MQLLGFWGYEPPRVPTPMMTNTGEVDMAATLSRMMVVVTF